MKKECEETRKALPKYLQGHVFRTTRNRIERHLSQCVMCKSEFEALRRTEETLLILRDVNASGGVVGRVKDGVFALGKIKKILYRPLWIAGIALAAAAVVYYVITPHQLAREIDSIVKSEPSSTPAAPPVAPVVPENAPSQGAAAEKHPPAAPDAKPKPAPPRPVKLPAAPEAPGAASSPSGTAAKPKPAPPRQAKSPSAPRPAPQLTTAPSETAVPPPPAPEPAQ